MNEIFHNGAFPRRGEIYYVKETSEPTGSEMRSNRHAVIVSADCLNSSSPVVQVIYITTRDKKPSPTHIDISTKQTHRIALCEQITTVSKERLTEYKGKLTKEQMSSMTEAMRHALNLTTKGEKTNYGYTA